VKDNLLITQRKCSDGAGCALVFTTYVPGTTMDDVVYIDFNQNVVKVVTDLVSDDVINSNTKLYIADIPLGISKYLDISRLVKNIYIADHHPNTAAMSHSMFSKFKREKSLIHGDITVNVYTHNGYNNNAHIAVSTEHCSAILLDSMLNNTSEQLPILKYIDDRDRHVNKYPETTAIAAAITSEDFSIDVLRKPIDELVQNGNVCITVNNKYITKILRNKHPITLTTIKDGYEIPITGVAVNSPILQSDICTALYNNDLTVLYSAAYCIVQQEDEPTLLVSLRSSSNILHYINVGEIARVYGGGGHPNVAGFAVKFSNVSFDGDTMVINNDKR